MERKLMNPLEQLIKANKDYHEAVDAIFLHEFEGLSEDEKGELKAKFGSFHNNIYQLMKEAQALVTSYFEDE